MTAELQLLDVRCLFSFVLDCNMKEFCFVCVFGYRCCELGKLE